MISEERRGVNFFLIVFWWACDLRKSRTLGQRSSGKAKCTLGRRVGVVSVALRISDLARCALARDAQRVKRGNKQTRTCCGCGRSARYSCSRHFHISVLMVQRRALETLRSLAEREETAVGTSADSSLQRTRVSAAIDDYVLLLKKV